MFWMGDVFPSRRVASPDLSCGVPLAAMHAFRAAEVFAAEDRSSEGRAMAESAEIVVMPGLVQVSGLAGDKR